MANAGLQGGDQFEKDLLEVVDIGDEFAKRAKKKITPIVIGAALDGKGPDDVPFRDYSAAYQKRKDAASGKHTKFMYGLKKKGRGRRMLSTNNFKWSRTGKNEVTLTWTGTGDMAIYGPLHNEGGGKMPQREWMHLNATNTKKRIDELIEIIVRARKTIFDRKYAR